MAAPDKAYVLRPVAPPIPASPAALPAVVTPAPASIAPVSVAVAPVSPAWRRNAVKASATDGRPMIAILIDDVGVARQNAELAMALDPSVTLAFMTYAADAPAQVAAARARGHEIMLHLPMEPLDHAENPGPNALAVGLTPGELERRIAWGLGRLGKRVAVLSNPSGVLNDLTHVVDAMWRSGAGACLGSARLLNGFCVMFHALMC